MAHDELEIPVFKNLGFRKAKLQDEIEALEVELASELAGDTNDAVKEKSRAARK